MLQQYGRKNIFEIGGIPDGVSDYVFEIKVLKISSATDVEGLSYDTKNQ